MLLASHLSIFITTFSEIMSNKKIELQVQISCDKCKTTILTTAAKQEGVNSISLDANKGVLTIIGTADAVELMWKLRKAKISTEIISFGPEKKEEKKEQEKKEEKKKEKKIECMPYQYGFPQIAYYEQYSESKQLPFQYGFPQIAYYEQYSESKQLPFQYGFPQIAYYEQYPESKQLPFQYGFSQIAYYEQYPESKQPPYQYGFS